MTLSEIYAPVEGDLKEFGRLLKKELDSEDELIRRIHEHILKMSGKFLRPAVTLLSAGLGQADRARATQLAVVIELIHTATLVHDDIIDNSDFRRNQPSVHSKWGRDISIVIGDYLYAKAFMLLAGLRDVRVNEAFAACAHVMCEGEMKQIEKRKDFLMDEKEYLKVIHKKTAALFQAACAGGAYLGGAPEGDIQKLADYGFNLGMAFQIVDDCLDLVAEAGAVGKSVGLDLNQSDITLPILYLFRDSTPEERRTLAAKLAEGGPELFADVRRRAIERKSVDRAMEKARSYVEACQSDLRPLKDGPHKTALSRLAQHCLDRALTRA